MGFGRKNNKAQPAESEAAEPQRAASGRRAAQKKRKPAEMLASVVNESAIGAAIDVLRRNEAFALPNGSAWVGLLLSVEEIGGLNQKQKGDATRGSIIELIAADKLQVIATKAMLDKELLGIVPTAETLERMDEYSLLTQAPYYWAVFRTEDNETLVADAIVDVPATYAAAVEISRGEASVAGVLPQVWEWAGGAAAAGSASAVDDEFDRVLVGANGVAAEAGDDPMAPAFSFAGADATPSFEALPEERTDFSFDAGTAEAFEDTQDASFQFDAAEFEAQFAESPAPASPSFPDDEVSSFDTSWEDEDETVSNGEDAAVAVAEQPAADDGYFQYLEANRDRVVDEKEVRDTIARRFMSTDLDLVVDLAEFERIFASGAPAIELEIAEDPSDWLGSQVAQLSRQANAELRALHDGNTDELRQLFVELMSKHVEVTMSAVSTEDPDSQFANLMNGAKLDYEALRAAAPQEIAEERRELLARFEAAATSRADQAAAHARANYEDKNRPKLERDLAQVGLDIDRRHEERYAHDRQTVLDMRRKDANVRMDVGTSRIFEVLSEHQAAQREGERVVLERWNSQMVQFIDENRKNNVARAMVLAEELARTNQVEELRREQAAALREVRRQHSERENELQAELRRNREEALADLQARQAAFESALAVEQGNTTAKSRLAEQLEGQMAILGEQYRDQYQGRISALEADKEAGELALDRLHADQKRTTFILIVLGVALVVAGVAVGVIAGWSWGHNQVAEAVPAALGLPGSLLS